jgi:hypothetical protein
MSTFKKHIDVVASVEEFNANNTAGMYKEPWVVYVGDGNGEYTIYTSNSQDTEQPMPDALVALSTRVDKLEEEKVYCLEDEYESLVKNGVGLVTNVNGETYEIQFDENKLYCIYEPEETEENPDEPENNEPEDGGEENTES